MKLGEISDIINIVVDNNPTTLWCVVFGNFFSCQLHTLCSTSVISLDPCAVHWHRKKQNPSPKILYTKNALHQKCFTLKMLYMWNVYVHTLLVVIYCR